MSNSNYNFTIKFFRPTQRPVVTNNGLLDSRTKRIIAQDRLIIAEQRILNVERQKSTSNLQLLTYEQKQLEKKLLSLQNSNQSIELRRRSISEGNIHRTASRNDTSDIHQSKLYTNKNSNVLFLPKTNNIPASFSAYSDGLISENPVLTSDTENSEEEEEEEEEEERNSEIRKQKPNQLPEITIIPPEDDVLHLV
ncbi:unnamed protein product [Rotaria sordida]|uniref:Uncharacterized protein n=1 Tax=Rotaria sordida TaxID=392033 RepID=A0A814AW60_9BILA|nr:unnamed protein product [Rotaria sordida]CAF3495595.1 unnamed protein product [Rotaria sordida]